MAQTDANETRTCSRCGAIFGSEDDLKDHIRSHVTNPLNADHICPQCGLAFTTPDGLEEHSLLHEEAQQAA